MFHPLLFLDLFTEPDALRHGLALPTFVVLSSFTGHPLYTLKWVVLSSAKQLDFKEMALNEICIKRCSMDLGPQGTYHLLKSPPEEGGTLRAWGSTLVTRWGLGGRAELLGVTKGL